MPFGAKHDSDAADTRHAGWPPGAADFWGEESASIQHALQDPSASEPSEQVRGPRPRRPAHARAWRGRKWSKAARPVTVPSKTEPVAAAMRARMRALPVPFPAVALVVMAVLAIAFAPLGGSGGSRVASSGHRAEHGNASASGLAVVMPPVVGGDLRRTQANADSRPLKHRAQAGRGRAARPRTRSTRHARAPLHPSSSAGASSPTLVSASESPTPTAASPQISATSSSSGGGSAPARTGTSSTPTSGAQATQPAKQASSTTQDRKQPTFGAHGSLGPGRSPNG